MEIKFSEDVQLILEGFTESARWEYVETAVKMQMENDVDPRDISPEMMDYNDIMAQIDEELEEGCSPWVEPSPLLLSCRMFIGCLRGARNERSFRYDDDEDINEFARYLCAGAIISGWKVMSNDGERISLVRAEGNEE